MEERTVTITIEEYKALVEARASLHNLEMYVTKSKDNYLAKDILQAIAGMEA